MCGIAGIHFDDGVTVAEEEHLRRMIGALGHRGPDGEGYLRRPGIGLGHARLSVIDLVGGAQPIQNEDGSVWVVFNGEIFNYLELRQTLVAAGHRFATASDTEVIVHLYEEHGDAFLERLNGQFAFALWDGRRRRLLLCRDRAGILPLYWCRVAGGVRSNPAIVFASEAKALFASGLVTARPDADGIDEVWTFWGPVAPRTVFQDVHQVCPGELVVITGAEVQHRRYWAWSFPPDGEHRRASVDSVSDELAALLGDATEKRLRADVPVGAYLSGGLDSSALIALLHRSIAASLHTFSIGFDDPVLDETAHQREVVDRFGTSHHHLQCTAAAIALTFPGVIHHTESPTLRSAPAPMRLLSQSAHAAGLKVVLTGEGADEVLGGYDIFKEAKVRRFWAVNRDSLWRPRLLKRLYPYLELGSAAGERYVRDFFGQGLADRDDAFFSHEPRWKTTAQCKLFWSAEFAERVTHDARERLRASLPAEFVRWHPFNRAEYLEAVTLLPGYLLSTQGDRMLMASSVEGRFPYLDHRLIAFANELHPTAKMPVLREKQLLRKAMQGVLPQATLCRRKLPYRAPDAAAFLGPQSPDYVADLTGAEALKRFGYFDPDRTGQLIRKLRRSRAPSVRDNMAFMGILSTQIWHKEFFG
jgi:asparagine synthase (glutamine-hydrolysing)